jgi:hypothetical protein
MGAGVAEDPPAAVHIQDCSERVRRPRRFDDAHPNVADFRRNGDPLVGHLELGDGCGLNVIEQLAGTVDAELVERWLGRHIGELLRGRFQNWLSHTGTTLLLCLVNKCHLPQAGGCQ